MKPYTEFDYQDDIRYFKEKLAITKDAPGRERLEKQIALLEDAVVIYRLNQPPRTQQ